MYEIAQSFVSLIGLAILIIILIVIIIMPRLIKKEEQKKEKISTDVDTNQILISIESLFEHHLKKIDIITELLKDWSTNSDNILKQMNTLQEEIKIQHQVYQRLFEINKLSQDQIPTSRLKSFKKLDQIKTILGDTISE